MVGWEGGEANNVTYRFARLVVHQPDIQDRDETEQAHTDQVDRTVPRRGIFERREHGVAYTCEQAEDD